MTTWALVRAVPRVAPVRVLVISAAMTTAFVVSSSDPTTAAGRLRASAALVAAALCFVLDDEAATTLAPTPVSRLTRRIVRVATATAFVAVWLALVIVAEDVLTGVGRPPVAALVETGAIALLAVAAACLAIGRTDDGRGGITGTFAGLLCFATVYLPPRWWWPLTPEPRVTRLAVLGAVALAVALLASADPARRRRWFG